MRGGISPDSRATNLTSHLLAAARDGVSLLVFRKTEMKISIFRLQNPFISGGPENPEKVNFRDGGGAP